MCVKDWSPVRVDFAGGWLDVPQYAQEGSFIVNCTVTPGISKPVQSFHFGGGVGGSAAQAYLEGRDPIEAELEQAGWQDAAIVMETGLCVWRSGKRPVLQTKQNPDFLRGKMALLWTGKAHATKELVTLERDYKAIGWAGLMAANAVASRSLLGIRGAIWLSYEQQLSEGMDPIEYAPYGDRPNAMKYCGAGHGGYALMFFTTSAHRSLFIDAQVKAKREVVPIEPYMREVGA